ncbi:hypothetical protein ACFSO7_20750 [Bacillus sp. CGMCC 1.16607]|uniref:hypothetical protein n=1 Tax=Bacillus sp. CGMCC 1.16607 TaxID=3351842 RepID=UPI00362E9588
MLEFLKDNTINWDAISAISNIMVVIATFITLLVTVWITIRNTTPRGKVRVALSNQFVNIHFINSGVVNITLLIGGIAKNNITDTGNPNGLMFDNIEIIKTLLPTENYHWKVSKISLSEKLIEKGNLKIGDTVKLKAIYLDSYRRKHIKSFAFKIIDPNPEIKLKLNT